MLTMTADQIRARAEALAARLNTMSGWYAELHEGVSAVGGGSAPGIELPTWVVAIEKQGLTLDGLEERLRHLAPPMIARIEKDRLLLDLRTVLPDQDAEIPALMQQV
jgi:L-seryl-tRNA(Ser) seleniumtransferase